MINGTKLKLRKGYKYNVAERKIARKIYDLKSNRRKAFQKWRELDAKINLLKAELDGKYGK